MRERNRLDEIVEEEARPGRWFVDLSGDANHLGPTMKRIAERAFRHGVERGWKIAMADSSFAPVIQPTGAEEKCRCGPEPHAPHEPPYHIREWGYGSRYPDARKGERRMGNEALNLVHGPTRPETRPIYQVSDYGSWQYDRRSGDDRRGAKF